MRKGAVSCSEGVVQHTSQLGPAGTRHDSRYLQKGNRMKQVILAALALLMAVAMGASPARAGEETATDVFLCAATTGAGQPLPVDINPADVTMRSDGATGLGYTFQATGHAMGSLPGAFTYEEHGYLFFTDPSNPASFVGSSYRSATFTLTPEGAGFPIQIMDTNPSAYTNDTLTTALADLSPQAQQLLGDLIGPQTGLMPADGSITYRSFTFTDELGTFSGYATPDSRNFAIEISFIP